MTQKEFPSDEVLKGKYCQIEQTGLEVMRSGNLVGNPLLKQFLRGDRWSISAGGYIYASDAGQFLAKAAEEIEAQEPALLMVKHEFLHITFTELVHLKESGVDITKLPNFRKVAGISTTDVSNYYFAVKEYFQQQFDPIKLRLFRMFVTADPKPVASNERTGALVAAFLRDDNDAVYRVKEEITQAADKSGLYFSTQYGTPSQVLFVTLGRFHKSPHADVLLPLLDSLNTQIGPTHLTDIRDVKVISTSMLDYRSGRGHVEFWPPVALRASEQIQGETKLLRPSTRVWYHKMQRMLERGSQ